MTSRIAGLIVTVAMLGACGSTDDGAWSRIPGPSNPTTTISWEESGPPEDLPAETPLDLMQQPDRKHWIRCEIAAPAALPLELNGNVPSYVDDRDRVCLGEPGQAQPTLCHQVQDFEARAFSITQCYAKVRELFAAKAQDSLGDHWSFKVLPLLPEIWSKTPEEVSRLSSRISVGMVELLAGGSAESAPGAPLCFPSGTMDPELAKLVSIQKMHNLLEGVSKNIEAVTSALSRGIDVQVNNDLRLTASVYFVEAPRPNIESQECSFQLPPSR